MTALRFCPGCEADGERSTVHGSGYGTVTAMMGVYYWDEGGRYHHHDPNTRTSEFRCSRGHHWVEVVSPGCEGCGTQAQKRVEATRFVEPPATATASDLSDLTALTGPSTLEIGRWASPTPGMTWTARTCGALF